MILGNAYLSLFFAAGQNPKSLKQSMSAYSQAVSVISIYIYINSQYKNITNSLLLNNFVIQNQWFSLVATFSSTNKTDHHDITELLLKWH